MKELRNLLILSCFFLMLGCNLDQNQEKQTKETQNTVTNAEKKSISGPLPEMSIYQLTSSWTNQNGEEIQLKKLRGNIVVAVMIYTSCTSACPILVEKVRGIHDQLTIAENNEVKYVFISIDPKDDTPEKMKAFAVKKEMDNNQFVFLRSSLDNTRTLSAVLGVKFKEVSKMNYKHSNIVSVLDQNGVISYQQKGLDVDGTAVVKAVRAIL